MGMEQSLFLSSCRGPVQGLSDWALASGGNGLSQLMALPTGHLPSSWSCPLGLGRTSFRAVIVTLGHGLLLDSSLLQPQGRERAQRTNHLILVLTVIF